MVETFEILEIVLMLIAGLASIANIIILILLFRTFHDSYKKLKAKFTKGLMTFIGFLLVQQVFFLIATVLINAIIRPEAGFKGGGPMFLLNILELVALIIFYRTTRE